MSFIKLESFLEIVICFSAASFYYNVGRVKERELLRNKILEKPQKTQKPQSWLEQSHF